MTLSQNRIKDIKKILIFCSTMPLILKFLRKNLQETIHLCSLHTDQNPPNTGAGTAFRVKGKVRRRSGPGSRSRSVMTSLGWRHQRPRLSYHVKNHSFFCMTPLSLRWVRPSMPYLIDIPILSSTPRNNAASRNPTG